MRPPCGPEAISWRHGSRARVFPTPAELRSQSELLVGYYRKSAGKPGIKHAEAVEQALCFGWIDSAGRRIDEERYQVRFTPRRKGSVWSAVNVARIAE